MAVHLAFAFGLAGVLWQWRRAVAGELNARQHQYVSDMNLVQQALAANNLGRAQELLNRHRPDTKPEVRNPKSDGDSTPNPQPSRDLRGWEWRYLWSQCQSDERLTLFRGPCPVTALAFSADGSQLAVRRDPANWFWVHNRWKAPRRLEPHPTTTPG